MKDLKDKEQIVNDLINTFNDRDELHQEYKKKMKEIIECAFFEFAEWTDDKDNGNENDLKKWIDNFVETHFITEK